MRIIIYIAIFTGFSASCADERTAEMNRVLKTFHTAIPEQRHIYLLIPSCVCKNCYCFRAEDLPEYFVNSFQIVSSIDTEKFIGFSNTLRDTNDQLIRLAFLDYGIKFVVTVRGSVIGVIPFTNLNQQSDSLNRYFLKVSKSCK